MINTKKVKEYIEKKNNIELSGLQYQILKAIIRGDEVYTARGIGRSLLYNGYADYLKDVLSKDTNREIASEEFDSIFTATMGLNDTVFNKTKTENTISKIKNVDVEIFNKEFECKYER